MNRIKWKVAWNQRHRKGFMWFDVCNAICITERIEWAAKKEKQRTKDAEKDMHRKKYIERDA